MNDHMVFTTGDDGFIRAGGFLVKKPAKAPISVLPDGLAVPAGLYTMHRASELVSLALHPSEEVVEPSICDYLFEQLNGSKAAVAAPRRTKRRRRNRPKRKSRSKK